MNDNDEEKPHRIDQDMTLPTLDLLACIITPYPTLCNHFHTLTIENARARLGMATIGYSELGA